MAGSSLKLVSSAQVDVGVFAARKMYKQTFAFVGDSATGSIPTLAFPLVGHIARVDYIAGATPLTNATTMKLIDPSTGTDVLAGSVTVTSGATSQIIYPIIASGIAIQPIAPPGSYTMTIAGNSVVSAVGQFVIYTIEGD
jgi:hypothetical protein